MTQQSLEGSPLAALVVIVMMFYGLLALLPLPVRRLTGAVIRGTVRGIILIPYEVGLFVLRGIIDVVCGARSRSTTAQELKRLVERVLENFVSGIRHWR